MIENTVLKGPKEDRWKFYYQYLSQLFELPSEAYSEHQVSLSLHDGYITYIYAKRRKSFSILSTRDTYETEYYIQDGMILGIVSVYSRLKSQYKVIVEQESDYSEDDIDDMLKSASPHAYRFRKRERQSEYRCESIMQEKSNNVHMTKEMHRRLLQLCHSDKNGNSQSSHIATQWLLSLNIE